MFVSRSRLDLALHNLQEMRELHAADVAYYRKKLEDRDDTIRTLTAELLLLRSKERPPLTPAERPSKPADEAIEEMVAKFGGSGRLRRQLQKHVLKQRSMNVDEDRIAHQVLNWSDPDSDEDAA